MSEQKTDDEKQNYVGMWLALGAGMGVALGAAFDNIALGLPIGLAIGLAIGAAQSFGAHSGQSDRDATSEDGE